MALEYLWGAAEKTRNQTYEERRKKALSLLGGKQTKAAYDKSHRERTARDLAAALRALYQQAETVEEVPDGEPPIKQPNFGLRRKPTKRRAFAGLVVALLLVGSAYLLKLPPFSSPSSSVVPPVGTVVNATTGRVVAHVVRRTTPQFVQVGGGGIFEACDRTTHPGCGVTTKKGVPLKVRIGDTVEFSTSLFNPNDIPIPYLKMYASTYGTGAGPGDWMAMSIKWPAGPGEHLSEPAPIDRVEVLYPHTASSPGLSYVPGSTVLLDPRLHLLAHLPDGITEGGIVLTDVGPPAWCSHCEQGYQRHINFKMRVTDHAV